MPLEQLVLAAMLSLAPLRDRAELGELADAIAHVVDDARPLFRDDETRAKTALLVVAVAFRESSFRNDAVSRTGDHCLLQVHGRPELADDVVACVRVGLAMMRESFRMCREHPLAFYAEGPRGCSSARAQRISRDRLALAERLYRAVRP